MKILREVSLTLIITVISRILESLYFVKGLQIHPFLNLGGLKRRKIRSLYPTGSDPLSSDLQKVIKDDVVVY